MAKRFLKVVIYLTDELLDDTDEVLGKALVAMVRDEQREVEAGRFSVLAATEG